MGLFSKKRNTYRYSRHWTSPVVNDWSLEINEIRNVWIDAFQREGLNFSPYASCMNVQGQYIENYNWNGNGSGKVEIIVSNGNLLSLGITMPYENESDLRKAENVTKEALMILKDKYQVVSN